MTLHDCVCHVGKSWLNLQRCAVYYTLVLGFLNLNVHCYACDLYEVESSAADELEPPQTLVL